MKNETEACYKVKNTKTSGSQKLFVDQKEKQLFVAILLNRFS